MDFSDPKFEWSDDEEVAGDAWKEYTLKFGKHTGKTMVSMISSKDTRGYLRYLCKWDKLEQGTRANVEAALAFYEAQKKQR